MQPRNKLILEFWDKSKELTVKNTNYRNFVHQFLMVLLKQDIGNTDLTTTSLTKKNSEIHAQIIAKEDGIFAGFEEFALLNKDLKIKPLKNDGDKISKGDILIDISGNAQKILERERTSLNLLQRMSGIATLTNALNKKLNNTQENQRFSAPGHFFKISREIKLAATRKTLWGLLDKKAVSIGGGLTHRLSLSDGIIIKDNHLKILKNSIENALMLVKDNSPHIEIEVENKKQALTAASLIKKLSNERNLFAIMLDKIKPQEIKAIIEELKNRHFYEYVLLEASGDIKPSNLMEYAGCGVDVISMGYITNSAKALDISQEIK